MTALYLPDKLQILRFEVYDVDLYDTIFGKVDGNYVPGLNKYIIDEDLSKHDCLGVFETRLNTLVMNEVHTGDLEGLTDSDTRKHGQIQCIHTY